MGFVSHKHSAHEKPRGLFYEVSRFRFWLGVLILIPVLTVYLLFFAEYLKAYEIISGSMLPTLQVDDYVLVRSTRHIPQRGTIVAFYNPDDLDEVLVKRIVGLPGDKIVVFAGFLYVNGWRDRSPCCTPVLFAPRFYKALVGEDEVFVLGDNRNNSYDSFEFGGLPARLLIGRVEYIYWPLSRMRRIDNSDFVLTPGSGDSHGK